LIGDGLRKLIPLCGELAPLLGEPGWRQATHLKKKAKQLVRGVAQISASKSPRVQATLNPAYGKLLDHANNILERARVLEKKAQIATSQSHATPRMVFLCGQLTTWIALTVQVCDTAYRRTQLGENVANDEKLFSGVAPKCRTLVVLNFSGYTEAQRSVQWPRRQPAGSVVRVATIAMR
jgi:hypothetical protein